MTTANTVARVIAAEATSGTTAERIADMRAIASVIANRAQQLGVSQYDVIANQVQFNAFGARMPAGTAALVDMAQDAIDYVAENGPTTNATFYATPGRVRGLPPGLDYETETAGHQFFSDPQFRSIDTALGDRLPNQFAYAQNPQNVPTPALSDSLSANFDPSSSASTDWGLNRDVAPVPYEAFNQWGAMAAAPPVQATVDRGFLNAPADLSGFADAMDAQRQTNTARAPVAPINSFQDPASAGPFGGDFTAPADRFAGPAPSLSQPFDRYVQTTSIPTAVDPNSYQPGTAPMVNTSAAPTNRVQSISIQPGQQGFLNAPPTNQPISQADVDRALFNVTGDGAFDPAFAQSLAASQVAPNSVQTQSFTPGLSQSSSAPAPITQADVNRALFDPATGQMDPSFVESMMSPQTSVVPTAVQSTSVSPGVDIASSRFSTPAKTSRIGQLPGLTDMARIDPLAGAINPATNVTGFLNAPATPADIDGFVEASREQRDDLMGIDSAETDAMEGHVAYEAQKAEAARQAAMMTANPALATPNFAQAMNPTVPSLSVPTVQSGFLGQPTIAAPAAVASQEINPTATPQQQAAGYQQAAATMAKAGMLNIGQQPPTDLSGELPTNFDVLGTTAAPDLETVDVAAQPAITNTQVDIPGPATTPVDQQQTAKTTTATRTTPAAVTQAQPSFSDRISKALNPGTAIGAAIGAGFLGLPGAVAGGFLGNKINGFLNAPSQPMQINSLGQSPDAVRSIWAGGQPVGTQAIASDGQTVTSMPGGLVGITNSYGVTTAFDSTGKGYAVFGGGPDQEKDVEGSGGSTGSIFG